MTEVSRTPDHKGTAAGVPYIAFAPANPGPGTPLVVLLHLMDPPRSEHAMAAAIPLGGLDAWKVYVGLPMSGERAPTGGFDEIMRLANEDGLMNLLAPVIEQAAKDLPAAVAALRAELGVETGPLALVGGSAGGAAVLQALCHGSLEVTVAAVLNPATRAAAVVEAMEELQGFVYPWNESSRQIAEYLDFVMRAPEVATRQTPLLFVVGADDAIRGLPVASKALSAALVATYDNPDRVSFISIEGLGHALAEEPGMEAAPQTEGAREVDAEVTKWLKRWLPAG